MLQYVRGLPLHLLSSILVQYYLQQYAFRGCSPSGGFLQREPCWGNVRGVRVFVGCRRESSNGGCLAAQQFDRCYAVLLLEVYFFMLLCFFGRTVCPMAVDPFRCVLQALFLLYKYVFLLCTSM